MMPRLLFIAVAILALLPGRARADAYTVAYDTVQATAYRNLSNGFLGAGVGVAQIDVNMSPETNHVAFTNIHFVLHQSSPGSAHPTAAGSIIYGRAPGFNGGVATGVTNAEYWNATEFINQVILSNAAISSKIVCESFTGGSTNQNNNLPFDCWVITQKVVLVSGANGTATNWQWPSSTYNGIAVGWSDSSGNPLTGISGPTQNGRSKPDLIAPKSAQVAASPSITGNNTTFTNSSYTSIEGTSLSAPFVAGAAAILMDKAMDTPALSNATDPRVIKSLLMTSARKMAGWHKGTNGTADDASAPLDFQQGAGLLQVKSAYDLLVAGEQAYGTGNVLSNGWDYASVGGTVPNRTRTYNLFLSNSFFLSNTFTVTATLNWYEDVSNPSYNSYGFSLQNLDLALKYNGSTLQYSTSIVDNVEHIWFTTNAPGVYTLEVTAGSTPTSYALSWNAVAIPEPTAMLLFGGALVGLLVVRRKRS